MVVARGLYLGFIGCYGNEWVHTPTFDRLAAEGVVFDQHYADQPDDAGAQRAWQTGCYHFPPAKPEEKSHDQEPANLFTLLAERDIATFLVHDEMSQILPAAPAGWRHAYGLESAGGPSLSPGLVSDALNQALLRLAPWRQWLLRFDLSISLRLDTLLACIVDEVQRRGLLDDLLVLVTSDHGQQLGEDKFRPGSRLLLHEELIHIPLILRLPGKAQAGRRISCLTQAIDILPTLFDLFGLPLPAVHGQSLLPLAEGQIDTIRPYACAGLCTGDTVEWALRSPDWAFLLSVSGPSTDSPIPAELYVKPEDRWEVNNVRQHHLEFAERLEQTLRLFVDATRRPGPLQYPDLPHPEQEPAKEQEDHPVASAERSMPT
jgi:hypothetical protein